MDKSFYKLYGFWWRVRDFSDEPDAIDVNGPYCPDCYIEMEFPDSAYEDVSTSDYPDMRFIQEWVGKIECPLCHKKKELKLNLSTSRANVALKIKSGYRATLSKISLEEPITQVKVRDQDDKYFIAAKMGQKDGKRVGVVYFGEKNKDQRKEDYSQIFIDIDQEQLRFDKSNKHPNDILSKFTVEFAESKSTTEKK